MDKNPMQRLLDQGQSPWLDNIRRGLITSGELKRMIAEDGIVGVTANPTIFEKAISGSTDYDSAIAELVQQGKSPNDIYKTLLVEDIPMPLTFSARYTTRRTASTGIFPSR